DRARSQRPGSRSPAPTGRPPRHRPDRAPPLHLRAHGPLARQEPAAEARRLLAPPGARGTRGGPSLSQSGASPSVWDTRSPTNSAPRAVSTPRPAPILRVTRKDRGAVATVLPGGTAGSTSRPLSFPEPFQARRDEPRQRVEVVAALEDRANARRQRGSPLGHPLESPVAEPDVRERIGLVCVEPGRDEQEVGLEGPDRRLGDLG